MSAPYGLTKIWDPEGSGSPELLYVMWYLTEDQKHLGMWAFVHSYPPQSDILYWTKGNTINKPFELTKSQEMLAKQSQTINWCLGRQIQPSRANYCSSVLPIHCVKTEINISEQLPLLVLMCSFEAFSFWMFNFCLAVKYTVRKWITEHSLTVEEKDNNSRWRLNRKYVSGYYANN